jgi:signal transduction histidine kinase
VVFRVVNPGGVVTLGGAELAAGAGFVLGLGLALLLAALWRGRVGRRAGLDPGLIDGAVLLAEAGRVTAASPGAEAMLGPVAGQALAGVLARHLGSGKPEALAALDRLSNGGEPLRLLARDAGGREIELAGEPLGGLIRLTLREAEPPEAGPGVAGAGADQLDGDAARRDREAGDLAALLVRAPLAIWSRGAEGRVEWAAGGLRDGAGLPAAAGAAGLAAARKGAAPAPEGEERFRLELPGPVGGDPAVLDAVELSGPRGGRLGFAVDASAALGSERTLARFVHTMTETFAHLTVGLAIFDRNQTLAMFNPALLRMWQADPVWLARRPSLREIVDTLRASRRIPETADFHAWRHRLTDLFRNTETADYEELWHLADGSDIRVLARPHPHGSLAFVFDDVTERLRLEQQYRHSVDLRRATLDRLDEGLAVFGPDGLLQLVNPAFHQIWGTDVETVHPAMHARELLPLVRGLTVETEVWTRLMTFITGEATRQAWSARLTLGNGRILGARFAPLPDGSTMAAFGDVTDSERIALALRERNEALESAEEMRAAVLDQISHRLRTPLNTIFGFGQMITSGHFGALNPAQREYAVGILESARHLLATVDEVTELAALEIGPLGDPGGGPPLAETLMLTGRLLEKRATEEGVSLRVVPPDGDAVPPGDAGRLRQIVFSMMTDAIIRCREGGAVELGARPGPDGGTEIFTCETLPEGRAADIARAEAESLTLPVIRRMMARDGGSFALLAGAGSGELGAVCRFRGRPPAGASRPADDPAGASRPADHMPGASRPADDIVGGGRPVPVVVSRAPDSR